MFTIITNCRALLFGMGLIMLGNGLQGTLLGVRASLEDFSTTVIGLVMSGYFIGLVCGCKFISKLVFRVGHVRCFGALASLASTAILVQAMFIDPFVWWIMRFVTGFCYAGIYVVAESWLNEAADNRTRGKLLSFYMLVSFAGMAGGQLMLNLSSPTGFELFVLSSLLISIAVIPILLSVAQAPHCEEMDYLSIYQLYRIAPLGVFGMLVNGMMYGAIYGMGPAYGAGSGMSVQQVSYFMGAFVLGGFLFQYPLGWLSDKYGRRRVIICSCILGALVSFGAGSYNGGGLSFIMFIAALGGFVMPLYALCGAHTNDYLNSKQMVAASGTLVLLSSFGAALGSPLTALVMDIAGDYSFYGCIGAMQAIVAVFALVVYLRRREEQPEERGEFVVMGTSPLTAMLNPDVDLADIEAVVGEPMSEVHASVEQLADRLEEERSEADTV